MSIQDKIYDVEAALEGEPEAKLFAELMDVFYNLERVNEYLAQEKLKSDAAFEYLGKQLRPHLK